MVYEQFFKMIQVEAKRIRVGFAHHRFKSKLDREKSKMSEAQEEVDRLKDRVRDLDRSLRDAENSLLTNMSRPIWTSSDSESTSEVMRETRTPAFSRSKKAIDSDCRWANVRIRRSRRKGRTMIAGPAVR